LYTWPAYATIIRVLTVLVRSGKVASIGHSGGFLKKVENRFCKIQKLPIFAIPICD